MKDFISWLIILAIFVFFLYQKGWILTNFQTVDAQEAYLLLEDDDNITLLDVRTPKEFKEDGYIENAKLIPLSELQNNLHMLDKAKKVLIYCRSGSRSISASRVLEKNGFEPINLSGGIIAWKSLGFDIKK